MVSVLVAAPRESAGVKMLKSVLARLANGELGMRLVIWKSGKQYTKDAEVQAVVDIQCALTQGAGLKMLQCVFARLVELELGNMAN